jgi:hypothetical protein
MKKAAEKELQSTLTSAGMEFAQAAVAGGTGVAGARAGYKGAGAGLKQHAHDEIAKGPGLTQNDQAMVKRLRTDCQEIRTNIAASEHEASRPGTTPQRKAELNKQIEADKVTLARKEKSLELTLKRGDLERQEAGQAAAQAKHDNEIGNAKQSAWAAASRGGDSAVAGIFRTETAQVDQQAKEEEVAQKEQEAAAEKSGADVAADQKLIDSWDQMISQLIGEATRTNENLDQTNRRLIEA